MKLPDTLKINVLAGLCLFLFVILIINSAHLKLVKLERDHYQQKIKQLASQIDTQNDAIERWLYDAASQKKQITKANETAKQSYMNHQKYINNVFLKQPVPAECHTAIQWGIEESKRLTRTWQ